MKCNRGQWLQAGYGPTFSSNAESDKRMVAIFKDFSKKFAHLRECIENSNNPQSSTIKGDVMQFLPLCQIGSMGEESDTESVASMKRFMGVISIFSRNNTHYKVAPIVLQPIGGCDCNECKAYKGKRFCDICKCGEDSETVAVHGKSRAAALCTALLAHAYKSQATDTAAHINLLCAIGHSGTCRTPTYCNGNSRDGNTFITEACHLKDLSMSDIRIIQHRADASKKLLAVTPLAPSLETLKQFICDLYVTSAISQVGIGKFGKRRITNTTITSSSDIHEKSTHEPRIRMHTSLQLKQGGSGHRKAASCMHSKMEKRREQAKRFIVEATQHRKCKGRGRTHTDTHADTQKEHEKEGSISPPDAKKQKTKDATCSKTQQPPEFSDKEKYEIVALPETDTQDKQLDQRAPTFKVKSNDQQKHKRRHVTVDLPHFRGMCTMSKARRKQKAKVSVLQISHSKNMKKSKANSTRITHKLPHIRNAITHVIKQTPRKGRTCNNETSLQKATNIPETQKRKQQFSWSDSDDDDNNFTDNETGNENESRRNKENYSHTDDSDDATSDTSDTSDTDDTDDTSDSDEELTNSKQNYNATNYKGMQIFEEANEDDAHMLFWDMR